MYIIDALKKIYNHPTIPLIIYKNKFIGGYT